MKRFVIFLDFDGVLHGSKTNSFFSNNNILANFLKDYDFIDIVLSTSWRESYSLDKIKKECIPELASKVIGTTPILNDGIIRGVRAREVEQYVKENNLEYYQFVCIDDIHFLFDNEFEQLILTDPQFGINDNTLSQLKTKLDYFVKKESKKALKG